MIDTNLIAHTDAQAPVALVAAPVPGLVVALVDRTGAVVGECRAGETAAEERGGGGVAGEQRGQGGVVTGARGYDERLIRHEFLLQSERGGRPRAH